jgi:hypothetical protein
LNNSRFLNSNSKCKKVKERCNSTLKESNYQPRTVYLAKLSFLIEGEIKTFHNQEKLKEFATIKPALQKILKGLLHKEEVTGVRQEDSRKNKPI